MVVERRKKSGGKMYIELGLRHCGTGITNTDSPSKYTNSHPTECVRSRVCVRRNHVIPNHNRTNAENINWKAFWMPEPPPPKKFEKKPLIRNFYRSLPQIVDFQLIAKLNCVSVCSLPFTPFTTLNRTVFLFGFSFQRSGHHEILSIQEEEEKITNVFVHFFARPFSFANWGRAP